MVGVSLAEEEICQRRMVPEPVPPGLDVVLERATHLERERPGGLVLFSATWGGSERFELNRPAKRLWRAIDGRRDVSEVIRIAGTGEEKALQVLAELLAHGLIRVGRGEKVT